MFYNLFLCLGSGIVTRRPLILQLIHVPRSAADRVESQDESEDTETAENDDFYDTEGTLYRTIYPSFMSSGLQKGQMFVFRVFQHFKRYILKGKKHIVTVVIWEFIIIHPMSQLI